MSSETPTVNEAKELVYGSEVLTMDGVELGHQIDVIYLKHDRNEPLTKGERIALRTMRDLGSPTRAILEMRQTDGQTLSRSEEVYLATHRATQNNRYAILMAKGTCEELSKNEKAEIQRFRLSSVI